MPSTSTTAGGVTTRTDQEGMVTEYAYDQLGRLTVTTYEDSTTVARDYDGAGNLKTLTDQRDYATDYAYDDAGRLSLVTYPDPDGEGEKVSPTEAFTYWETGTLRERTDRNQVTTAYAYDAASRAVTTTYPDGTTISHAYDKAGRTTEILVANATPTQLSKISSVYDALGRLTSETQELGTGTGKTVEFDYDLAGNTTGIDYPGDLALSLDYDAVYRLTTITDDASPNSPVGQYTYNKAGEVTRLGLKNGAWSQYSYDAVGRLKTLANYNPQGWVISSNSYVRNKVGCPKKITATRRVAWTKLRFVV